jgi:hypothetical protein
MIFPTIVYKCPGNHQRTGGTYDLLGINDSSGLSVALSEGWFLTLPEAIEGKPADPSEDAPPTRAELESKASEFGLKFDGRTTDRRLAELIEAALGKEE